MSQDTERQELTTATSQTPSMLTASSTGTQLQSHGPGSSHAELWERHSFETTIQLVRHNGHDGRRFTLVDSNGSIPWMQSSGGRSIPLYLTPFVPRNLENPVRINNHLDADRIVFFPPREQSRPEPYLLLHAKKVPTFGTTSDSTRDIIELVHLPARIIQAGRKKQLHLEPSDLVSNVQGLDQWWQEDPKESSIFVLANPTNEEQAGISELTLTRRSGNVPEVGTSSQGTYKVAYRTKVEKDTSEASDDMPPSRGDEGVLNWLETSFNPDQDELGSVNESL